MVGFIINVFVGSFKCYVIFGISQSMKPIRYSSIQQFLLNMMLQKPHLDVKIWCFPKNVMPSILKHLLFFSFVGYFETPKVYFKMEFH